MSPKVADTVPCVLCILDLFLVIRLTTLLQSLVMPYFLRTRSWAGHVQNVLNDAGLALQESIQLFSWYFTFNPRTNRGIRRADSIDIVVSFILCSGLNLLIDSLYDFTRHGKLRVITTTYMGNTEYEALEQLIHLPNTQVKIELNSLEHRLHAKAFLFNRSDGTSVAYVGSANISKSALTTGEEWVVKIREQDCREPIYDVRCSFEYLWNNYQFVTVTPTNRAQIESAIMNGGK